MTRQRVKYIKVDKGAVIPGIGQGGKGGYIFEGMQCNGNQGGGKIGRMYYEDGVLRIQKVNDKGEVVREFGTSATGIGNESFAKRGDWLNLHPRVADMWLSDDEPAAAGQDAKPVQQQQQNGQQRR